MDTEISEAGSSRQNSHPSERINLRGVSNERMVGQRNGHSARSHPYHDPDVAEEQCVAGYANHQRGYEPSIEERISGIGGVSVGRQFLGGWLFC